MTGPVFVPLAPADASWMDRIACRDVDPETFFLPETTRGVNAVHAVQEARAVCLACPVAAQCVQWARDTDSRHGVWAGQLIPEHRGPGRLSSTVPPLGGPGQSWTREEDALAANSALTAQDVADLTGRSPEAVKSRRETLGRRRRRRSPRQQWTSEEDRHASNLRLTPSEVADLTGRSPSAVGARRARIGWGAA